MFGGKMELTYIEQAFFVGFNKFLGMSALPEMDTKVVNGKILLDGFCLWEQVKIGQFRVDFKVSYWWIKPDGTQGKRVVIVECDSQKFHERDEEERRYEKARDRYLNTNGHTVFHFTGIELIERPYNIASEIVQYLQGGEHGPH